MIEQEGLLPVSGEEGAERKQNSHTDRLMSPVRVIVYLTTILSKHAGKVKSDYRLNCDKTPKSV